MLLPDHLTAAPQVRARGICVVLSWAPGHDAVPLVQRCVGLVERFGEGRATVVHHASSAVVVDEVAAARLDRAPDGGLHGIVLSRGATVPAAPGTADGRPVEAAAPGPFALVWRRPDGEVRLCADAAGLQHVHLWRSDGCCSVSNSAVVLAALGRARADWQALVTLGSLGHLLGDETPFDTVTLLPAGWAGRLVDGRPERLGTTGSSGTAGAAGTPGTTGATGGRGADAVAHGVDAVRRAVAACVTAAPATGLELSGGFDSRLVLAALGPADRQGRAAVTLGAADDPDVRIARALAGTAGLDWRSVALDGLAALPDDAVLDYAQRIALTRQFSGDPLAGTVLDWAEQLLGGGPRITGQNGELSRGFYYPGQPDAPRATPLLARALLRWRLTSNHAIDPAVLAARTRGDLLAGVSAAVVAALVGQEGSWLAATDRFYLEQRMRRWVGLDFSTAAPDRCVLAPFFHPDYVAWSLGAPARAKRGNRLFAQVLTALDPALAEPALEGRRSPRSYAHPRVSDHATDAAAFARKVRRRVLRRGSADAGKPPVGAAAVSAAVRRAWQARPDALDAALSHPELDADVVAGIARGTRWASVATVALLLNVDGLTRSLDR